MKKKAMTIPIVASIVMVMVTLFLIYFLLFTDFSKTKQKMINYYSQTANENIQLIKQGFEKTALFWGVMKTADELATYGGVSSATKDSAVGNPANFCPLMETSQITAGGESTIFWAVAGNQKIVKRVPFIYFEDKNLIAGDVSFPLLNNAQHAEYLEDVANDVYDLSLIIQVLFLKPGTINITLIQDSRKQSLIVDKDGIYEIDFLNNAFIRSANDVNMHIIGKNASLENDNIAKIKQVAVSIYNGSVVLDSNNLLNSFLSNATNNLKTELLTRDDDIILEVGEFTGSLTPKEFGPESYIQGLMWASDDKGITATIMDPFGSNVSAFIRSRGIVDEDIYIRYWYLYDAGIYFVNNLEGLVKARIWEKLNELGDYKYDDKYTPKGCGCHGQWWCCWYTPVFCENDNPDYRYNSSQIRDKINSALLELSNDLNSKYNAEGINWSISLLYFNFTSCSPKTNKYLSFDQNISNDEFVSNQFEHYEAKNVYLRKRWYFFCDLDTRGRSDIHCYSTYSHRYIVKNLPVLVEIKDTKYNITNSSGAKNDLALKFFVEIDRVDDNCCDGHNCESLTLGCNRPIRINAADIPVIPNTDIPLAITDVFVSGITETSATISWKTTKLATPNITILTAGINEAFAEETSFSKNIGSLTPLTPDTTYDYVIIIPTTGIYYSGFFTTRNDIDCEIKSLSTSGTSGIIDINATVECNKEILNADEMYFSGIDDSISGTDNFEAILHCTEPCGKKTNYSAQCDTTLYYDFDYNISAQFTKDTFTLINKTPITINNGNTHPNIYFVTNESAKLIFFNETPGLIMKINDSLGTSKIFSENPQKTYTCNFNGLNYDTRYPDDVNYYNISYNDTLMRDDFFFKTEPYIQITPTDTTAEINISTTRTGLNPTLDSLSYTTSVDTVTGKIYSVNITGLAKDTEYSNNLTIGTKKYFIFFKTNS